MIQRLKAWFVRLFDAELKAIVEAHIVKVFEGDLKALRLKMQAFETCLKEEPSHWRAEVEVLASDDELRKVK